MPWNRCSAHVLVGEAESVPDQVPDRLWPDHALAAKAEPEAFVIETIMYFGIGFLCASLLGLVIIPLVHNRAARLTTRRLEAATPLSMAEIQADKDQLRAEFAMSTRRLEMSVEQLKARSTGQLSELGKKTEAITILKHELGAKTADPLTMYLNDICTIPSNLAGHAAISVPFGSAVPADAPGGAAALPIGVQVLAPARGEQVMFRVARAIESAAPRVSVAQPFL